ncbi:unnamed protein product [Hanseniaspora opuntiae]
MSDHKTNVEAFKFIDDKPYLKNERTSSENDGIQESEKIDIERIQSFVSLFNQQTNEDSVESIIKYFFKQIFTDFNKFSNCNLNCIVISGLLIRGNYLNDILILEYLQGLLKAKQLHKIKLPIYPEEFEWTIIFNLVEEINKHVHVLSFTKDDLDTLQTEFEESLEETKKETVNALDDHYQQQEKSKLHKHIYQVIKSSGTSDEVVHKLSSQAGNDSEAIISAILLMCSQEKLYSRIYENILMKICEIGSVWETSLTTNFERFYLNEIEDEEIYPDLSNIKHLSQLFAKLLAKDSLDFKVLKIVKINSRDTTERKRVFLKYLFTELVSEMSLNNVKKIMLHNKILKPYFKDTIFPDSPKDTIYSINFFTAIGLGELTVKMRKQMEALKKG